MGYWDPPDYDGPCPVCHGFDVTGAAGCICPAACIGGLGPFPGDCWAGPGEPCRRNALSRALRLGTHRARFTREQHATIRDRAEAMKRADALEAAAAEAEAREVTEAHARADEIDGLLATDAEPTEAELAAGDFAYDAARERALTRPRRLGP